MERIYWLSYDLGVGGDYEKLYEWLDDHDARPCGQSVAFFTYKSRRRDIGIDEALEQELTHLLDLRPNNKLYIIRRKDDGKLSGSFIYGKRSSSPWEGYGKKPNGNDDE